MIREGISFRGDRSRNLTSEDEDISKELYNTMVSYNGLIYLFKGIDGEFCFIESTTSFREIRVPVESVYIVVEKKEVPEQK